MSDWPQTSQNAYRSIVAQERKRTPSQNDRLWPLLREVSEQLEHCGNHYTPEEWLAIFLDACGHKMTFLPSLDGRGLVAHRPSSRLLSVEEMSELLECIAAEGIQRGVKFRDEGGRDDTR